MINSSKVLHHQSAYHDSYSISGATKFIRHTHNAGCKISVQSSLRVSLFAANVKR